MGATKTHTHNEIFKYAQTHTYTINARFNTKNLMNKQIRMLTIGSARQLILNAFETPNHNLNGK